MSIPYDTVYGTKSTRGTMQTPQEDYFCTVCNALDITVRAGICDRCAHHLNAKKAA